MILFGLLEDSANKYPDSIAVEVQEKSITYKKLYEASIKMSKIFSNRQDNIGILVDKSIEAVISIYAISKAQCTYIPLDCSAPGERLQYICNNCDMSCVITTKKYESKLSQIKHNFEKIIIINDLENYDVIDTNIPKDLENAQPVNSYLEDTAYILYTSGSTGVPKGVAISNNAALAFVNWAHTYFELSNVDVFSSHAPFYFDLSIFDLFACMKAGGKLVIIPSGISAFPASLAKYIQDKKITVWYSVPSILSKLCMFGTMENYDLKQLKKVIFAGEVFPYKYLNDLMSKLTNARFFNLYGPTETNVITYYEVKEKLEEEIPIGRSCPYANIKVIGEDGQEVDVGEMGELVVASETLMNGYYNASELTNKKVRFLSQLGFEEDKYYFTGDIVEVLEHGEYQYIGRKDNQVKIAGFRIELEEIEAILNKHLDIIESMAVCKENQTGGKFIKLKIVAKRPIEKSELMSYLKKYLPDYMITPEIEFCEQLERNGRGKLIRINT